jgi:hypothetical protein
MIGDRFPRNAFDTSANGQHLLDAEFSFSRLSRIRSPTILFHLISSFHRYLCVPTSVPSALSLFFVLAPFIFPKLEPANLELFRYPNVSKKYVNI